MIHGPCAPHIEDTPVLSDANPVSVSIYGQPSTSFEVSVDGSAAQEITTDASGDAATNLDLAPGARNVCVTTMPSGGEWENCRRIVVVP